MSCLRDNEFSMFSIYLLSSTKFLMLCPIIYQGKILTIESHKKILPFVVLS